MRALSWTIGTIALLASGGYVLVYVYRWEWHRALLVGILFLAALVALSVALVLRRVDRLEQRLRSAAGHPRPGTLHRLCTAPVQKPPFRWLKAEDVAGAHIFIPVLLGGGVLLSGAAWLVERVAGAGARAGVEEELADDLRQIAFPAAPLVPARGEALAAGSTADDAGLRMLLGLTDRAVET